VQRNGFKNFELKVLHLPARIWKHSIFVFCLIILVCGYLWLLCTIRENQWPMPICNWSASSSPNFSNYQYLMMLYVMALWLLLILVFLCNDLTFFLDKRLIPYFNSKHNQAYNSFKHLSKKKFQTSLKWKFDTVDIRVTETQYPTEHHIWRIILQWPCE
jgi:hypothetical protein